MNFIKNIFLFFKKLFDKEDSIKMIEKSVETVPKENEMSFRESLKINAVKKHNEKKVETLICVGDGLGIQNKISY